ncbi:MAG TPA: LytTR family DNA-binding domain-containing protein [Gemmatimonadaceae bacterium]
MRALIVDDEAPARAKVRRLLEAAGDVEILGEATTGREAVAAIKRSRPDIVFLDIQMPGLDGFAVLDAIEASGDALPHIVFVTADDRLAIRAFEHGAIDYLLKPFTPDRFARVLDRARDRRSSRTAPTRPTSAFLKRLLVIDDGRALFIPVDRIDRIEAERNYVVITAGAEVCRLRATLSAVAARLDPSQFLRINRSTLVRLDAVASMTEWSHGDYKVLMSDGTELIWSRRFRDAAEEEFGLRG